MPLLRLETNLPAEKIPADFASKLTKVIAASLGKPHDYCVANIIPGVIASWGGKDVPQAQATLFSIGALGVEENKTHSKAIADIVEIELGISSDRMYINFVNGSTSNTGYNKTTFHEIYGDVLPF